MLSNQSDLAFNITLEILKGCGYSCADCAIDKNATSDFVGPGDHERLIILADQMKEAGYRLHELTLGPTDVVSSKSGLSILDSPLVKDLAERYSSLTVSLALLFDTGLVEFAKKVDRLMAGKKFRLVVPATLKNAGNPKYLAMIKRRIQILNEHMHETQFKLVYLTINMVNASVEEFSLTNNQMVQELDIGMEKLVEYVFPHSRRGLDNLLVRQEFIRDFAAFTRGIHECKDTRYNRYLIPTVSDSVEVVYHRGELYYTPVLMEKFPLFSDAFIVPRPWTAEAVIDYRSEMYYNNLLNYSNHPACGDCCFMDHCARGDVQLIMHHIGHDECLLDMKNRWDLNPSTNPVRGDD